MTSRLPIWTGVVAAAQLIAVIYFALYQPDVVKARAVERMCRDAGRLETAGKLEEAEKLLRRVTGDHYNKSPSAAKAFLMLALHQLHYRDEIDDAKKNLESVVREFPEFVEAEVAAEYLLFINKVGGKNLLKLYFGACGKRMRDNHADALADLDNLIEHWPSNPATPYALYQAYEIAIHRLNDSTRAKIYQNKLMLVWPNSDLAPLGKVR